MALVRERRQLWHRQFLHINLSDSLCSLSFIPSFGSSNLLFWSGGSVFYPFLLLKSFSISFPIALYILLSFVTAFIIMTTWTMSLITKCKKGSLPSVWDNHILKVPFLFFCTHWWGYYKEKGFFFHFTPWYLFLLCHPLIYSPLTDLLMSFFEWEKKKKNKENEWIWDWMNCARNYDNNLEAQRCLISVPPSPLFLFFLVLHLTTSPHPSLLTLHFSSPFTSPHPSLLFSSLTQVGVQILSVKGVVDKSIPVYAKLRYGQ